MTAEIAILNRTAVALAADSAVTISVRGAEKTYDSVDKLFQLTDRDPVGIMVYGGAEYMDIPIETVIKSFRKSGLASRKPFLRDYATAFFGFLEQEVPVPEQVSDSNVERILYGQLWQVRQIAIRETWKSLDEAQPIDYRSQFNSSLTSALNNCIEDLRGIDACSVISEIDEGSLATTYADVIDKINSELFPEDFNKEIAKLIEELSGLALRRNVYSDNHTGIVFAGFGSDEWFPSLQVFETDGLIAGKVKRQQIQDVDIDRGGSGAHIEPLAQKEMVQRFLTGVDPAYERYMRELFKSLLIGIGREIVVEFSDGSETSTDDIIAKRLKALADQAMQQITESADRRKMVNFRQKIEDMVHFLSKSDLAKMAESLVSITSMKRKFSAEQESVAGPVDVAVISKGDGFVWIKRKHYFERELNHRYFLERDCVSLNLGG